MDEAQKKWDAIYREKQHLPAPAPAEVLTDNQFLLPCEGHALDLACGLGANAIVLATSGLSVQAWDISPVALNALSLSSAQLHLKITVKPCNLTPADFPENTFDVIVVSRFLDRGLCHAIIAALKPDGLLFYQTFCQHKLTTEGPNNPNYLLARNELLELFSPLITVYYRENHHLGDLQLGNRNEAMYIGQKGTDKHDRKLRP